MGATHVDVQERLDNHNNHTYGNHRYTVSADDWSLFLCLEVADYDHAIRLERKIKSMKSRSYILNLKKYDELQQKIILGTST